MITQHLTQTADAILATYQTQVDAIEQSVALIQECRGTLGTVYTCGNGGSAATAAHFVNDLVKAAGCRAICLTDNVPLLTAYGNDESYGMALYEIANRLFRKGDMVFAISVSGTSLNVVMAEAVKTARPYAVPVIGLGSLMQGAKDGRNTRFYADVFIEAQSEQMMVAESVHLAICHAIIVELTQ